VTYYRPAGPKFLILEGWPVVTHDPNVTFDVDLASEIISISREAFQRPRGTKMIDMGNLVLLRDTAWQTFFHCSVEVLILPRNIRHIDRNALISLYLREIVIDSNQHGFWTRDGILYYIGKFHFYPNGKSGPWQSPSEVDELLEGAFAHCKMLESVHFGESGVTFVPSDIFKNCGIKKLHSSSRID
jgi:hypothetical protein